MLIQKCPIVLKQRGCNTTVHSPAVRSSALFMGACKDFIYEKTYTRCTIAIHTKFKASSCTTVTVSSSVFQIQSHFSLTLGESSPAHTCIHTCTLLDDVNMLEVIFPSAFHSVCHLPSPATLKASALFVLEE